MKNSLRLITLALTLSFIGNTNAQSFLKRKTDKKPTFKEMQLQFDEWAKHTDLKKARHWKYFKRWENEMQLHTDFKGELADPALFINEAVRVADEKNANRSDKFMTASWSPVGPFTLPGNETGYMQNGIGRINCIAFHPTDANTYFIGVAQGGVWKTTNNGVSWTPLTDNLPIERISDIAIDPNDPNTMYISVCDFEYIDWGLVLNGVKRNTHFGLGVYKTTDGGLTWTPTGLSFQMTQGEASLIRKILVNPANSSHLVACGVSGMYTSIDAGNTWNHTMDTLFWDMVQDPVTPNILYAASGWLLYENFGHAGIYKSTDFGNTWTMLPTGIPATGSVQRIKLAVAPSDNNYIYAMCVDNQFGSYGVYKSVNAGATWTFINPGVNLLEGGTGGSTGGQGTYDLGFSVNKLDKNTVYVGGVNVWASTDGANTFNPVAYWQTVYGPTIHGDIHYIETQPSTGNIFVASDGGLYRTTNMIAQPWTAASGGSPWPTTWTTISNGMNISSFYRLSSSRNATGRLLAGAQDNGTFYFDGTAWNTIFGGDGMDNYLDPLDDNTLIASSQYGNFGMSQDGGLSFPFTGFNVAGEPGEWTSPLTADYNNPGTLYAGFTNVNQSTDGGMSWTPLTPMPPNGLNDNELCAIAVSNSNSNVLYAARRIHYEYNSPSTIYVTHDQGASWTNITAGLPDTCYFTSIDISQTDPNTAYLTMANFGPGMKVFKTTNAGASWQNISYNLPNVPVNCVKTCPNSSIVMVATDLGFYILNTATSTWDSYSSGLPNVILSDIEFNTTLNKVYLATFGRGIWETDLTAFTAGVQSVTASPIDVNLYPSPNNGNFTIALNGKEAAAEVINLNIVDVTGRTVFSTILNGQTTYQEKLNLASGIYYAKVKSKSLNGVKTFIVK